MLLRELLLLLLLVPRATCHAPRATGHEGMNTADAAGADAEDKLDAAINELVDAVDRSSLRGIRREALECSLRCFDADPDADHDALQACISGCEAKLRAADAVLGDEIDEVFTKVQACAVTCLPEEALAAAVGGGEQAQPLSDAQLRSVSACLTNCVDVSVANMGECKRRVEDNIAKLGRR